MGWRKSKRLVQTQKTCQCSHHSSYGLSVWISKIRVKTSDDWKVLSPLASAMFSPGIDQIANDFKVPRNVAIGATTTGFVVLLGIGPLILAPLSETFGRRKLYIICFSIFSLLQIPTALSPNIQSLIIVRVLSGFFGSEFGRDVFIDAFY